MTPLTLWSCLSPRIGRSRAFSRPWSHSTRLLAYWSVRCQAAGSSASSTAGYTAAPVGGDLDGPNACSAHGLLEEPLGGVSVSSGGHEHVDDLAELVDRAVHIAPLPCHLHVGLLDVPAVADGVAAGPGSLGQQRREPLHPPVGRHVVDLGAPFDEEFFDVAVRQAVAQVPAHRQHDDLGWETEAGEGRAGAGSQTRAARSPAGSLATQRRSP
jgi:hypothetical protein